MKLNTKRRILITCLSLLGIGTLAGCGGTNAATVTNSITSSIYGSIGSIEINGEAYDSSKTYSSGDTLTFVITTEEDFIIDTATVNGNAASRILGETNKYQYTLTAGTNKISATFTVDKTIDFVEKFKLNISQETFEAVMADDSDYDFRENGIEEMNLDGYRYCVDGDTTHFETKKEGYTVKVRYLGIDTPESSSVVEKWGKSASEFNKSILDEDIGTATHVILQSQGRAMYETLSDTQDESVWESEVDTYNRNLAYVWYTTVENPTLNDFRCLNLETMYMGYSQGLGNAEDEMGEYFYTYFVKANLSARENARNYYSNEKDVNYYYDWNVEPVDLKLEDLYKTSTNAYSTDSEYADNYTFYRVHGYVTRKVEQSYFIQDKPSYERGAGGSLPEAYGIYVFTYTTNNLREGDEVYVIGVISTYGGSYQMQGTSYDTLKPDENKDTIIQSRGNEIEPISLTAAEYEEAEYCNVLVSITDQMDCYQKDGSSYTYNRGGLYEIDVTGEDEDNDYTMKYPYYFTDNMIVTFGKSAVTNTDNYRIKITNEVLITHGGQSSYSYKFFSGGTNIYSPNGAKYAYSKSNNYLDEYDDNGNKITYVTTEYEARSFTSLTCISQPYVSTGGNSQITMLIVSRADVTLAYTT